MKLPLLITLFGVAMPMMVQNHGAGALEREPDSLIATLKQYMEAVQSQHQPLHGHTFDYRLARVSDLESRDRYHFFGKCIALVVKIFKKVLFTFR